MNTYLISFLTVLVLIFIIRLLIISRSKMKTFLISFLILLVLLSTGRTMYGAEGIVIFMVLFVVYVPMIITEAFVLRWLFTDFDTEDSVMASFFINFVSIVFAIFITHSRMADALLKNMVDSGYGIGALIGIVVINIYIQLFVLKLEYKDVLSIRGVIGILFAHIVSIGVLIGVLKWLIIPVPPYLF